MAAVFDSRPSMASNGLPTWLQLEDLNDLQLAALAQLTAVQCSKGQDGNIPLSAILTYLPARSPAVHTDGQPVPKLDLVPPCPC